MPDGSIRKLKGDTTAGERYPMNVVNGRYMDVWVARAGGSTSSYYYDYQSVSSSPDRVVYRSYYYAYAFGGVAYAVTLSDSSNTFTHIGSRLAFKTRELAEYAGRQFVEIWADYVFKPEEEK